ncbi:AbiJ-NTD4 domain-containing protein [Pseudooceanicola sp.]|uniref:AbiJ-NTD4 domain-containing protein n=1 Tax=Pseudooceanicola sp. TaxID=1914328 RepID=UPI0035146F43
MEDHEPYVPFSQRSGLVPAPPQLKLGEVSDELRRLLDYNINLEIERESDVGMYSTIFSVRWRRVSKDLHVEFFGQRASTYKDDPETVRRNLEGFVETADIGRLFDLVEFLVRHPGSSGEFMREVSASFVKARSAYRLVDGMIVAIGTEQQGTAFETAIAAAKSAGENAARKHLVGAGSHLRNGDWSGSIRESIHAVEAMALKLSPGTKSLGPALAELEKAGHIHKALKTAFGSLYGFTSDQEGVRHALVFEDEANVDEADAMFMLGACASFVSYLIQRTTQLPVNEERRS